MRRADKLNTTLKNLRDKRIFGIMELPLIVSSYHQMGKTMNEEAEEGDKNFWMNFQLCFDSAVGLTLVKCRLRNDGPIEQVEEHYATVTPKVIAREASQIEAKISEKITNAVFTDISVFNPATDEVSELERLVTKFHAEVASVINTAKKRVEDISAMGDLSCEALEKRVFASTSVNQITASIAPKIRDFLQIFPLLTPSGKLVCFELDENTGEAKVCQAPPEYDQMEVYYNRRLKRGPQRGYNYQNKRFRNNY